MPKLPVRVSSTGVRRARSLRWVTAADPPVPGVDPDATRDPGRPAPPRTGPGNAGRRGWRDRHGRGLRADVLPPGLPRSRTRGGGFDDLVLEAVDRLRAGVGDRLDSVQVSVEDIPPPEVTDALADGESVPLGSAIPADAGQPPRLVLYRRTVELRAAAGPELAELVYDVALEQVADLLGMLPEDIDPEYGEPD